MKKADLASTTESKPERESGLNLSSQNQAINELNEQPLKEDDLCPKCGKGVITYDGLLNLTCPLCGFSGNRGVFTC
jgi:hypothetical protein